MYDSHTMNLNHLRYFYEVARAGNMRRAAAKIGISQPALSKQIQALEDTIGLQLFYRTPKGLQPTADGEVAYAHCEKIFGHLRDLELSLEARRTGAAGRLSIGVIHSISTHVLPGFVRRYREAYDKVRIKIMTVRSKAVLHALAEHKVDIGLVAEEPSGEEFTWRAFAKTPLVVVASPKSSLAGRTLSVEDLNKVDMVAFDPPAPTRRVTERYLASHGIEPRVMAECASLDTIKELVAADVGFAVLPAPTIELEESAGRLVRVPVKDWSLERTLYLVHLGGPSLAPTVRHFVDLFPTLAT